MLLCFLDRHDHYPDVPVIAVTISGNIWIMIAMIIIQMFPEIVTAITGNL